MYHNPIINVIYSRVHVIPASGEYKVMLLYKGLLAIDLLMRVNLNYRSRAVTQGFLNTIFLGKSF